jgi:phage terminase large subunit-like protein
MQRVATYRRTVDLNPFIPSEPHPRQRQALLLSDIAELFWGGAAGPGKTWGVLAMAAQFVETPGYAALLLRTNFADLNQPESWIPLSKAWWMNKAHWSATDRRWTFPSGATITFGYLERDDSVYQYDSAAYQFIGIDELTQHSLFRYTFLFSRLRRPSAGPLADIPLRMRSASNPGGRGHAWVKERFVDPKTRKAGCVYIPARLEDNPHIDAEAYRRDSLSKLDPITRKQREEGDWNAVEGGRFQRHWFGRYDTMDAGTTIRLLTPDGKVDVKRSFRLATVKRFTIVDPAASISTQADWTVCGSFAVTVTGDLVWLGLDRFRAEVPDIIPRIGRSVTRWRPQWTGIEAVGANSAVLVLARRHTNPTINAIGLDPAGRDKLVHATRGIVLAASGRVYLPAPGVDASFPLDDLLTELELFTGDDRVDAHDDQVDVLSYAAEAMDGPPIDPRKAVPQVIVPRVLN